MTQIVALKIAASACALLWAFVAHANRWDFVLIVGFAGLGVAFGASAAKNLGKMGAREWSNEE